jgi:SAM-dependent methyltransferase
MSSTISTWNRRSQEQYDDIPAQYVPTQRHQDLCQQEFLAAQTDPASARRTKIVRKKMSKEKPTDFGGDIAWETELKAFASLPYPPYYKLPFHSIAGGWLSKQAACFNRQAMQAIYNDAHPESCLGVRRELAAFVPPAAKVVVDLGSGDGDGPSAVARLLPDATVHAVEASPFMIIAGKRQNRDVGSDRLMWHHALAEDLGGGKTGLDDGCADCVTITLVLHECSDEGKAAILRSAFNLLKPGGTIVLSDTPQDDLFTFRGFYEPHRDAWLNFDPVASMTHAGFDQVQSQGIIGGDSEVLNEKAQREQTTEEHTHNRLFVYTARKPVLKCRL